MMSFVVFCGKFDALGMIPGITVLTQELYTMMCSAILGHQPFLIIIVVVKTTTLQSWQVIIVAIVAIVVSF